MLVRFEVPPLPSPFEFAGNFILLLCNPSKGHNPSPRDCPTRIVSRCPSPCPDYPVRNDELMARCTYIHLCIVQNQVLQMDELAGNPHVGDSLEEIGPLCKTLPDF